MNPNESGLKNFFGLIHIGLDTDFGIVQIVSEGIPI